MLKHSQMRFLSCGLAATASSGRSHEEPRCVDEWLQTCEQLGSFPRAVDRRRDYRWEAEQESVSNERTRQVA